MDVKLWIRRAIQFTKHFVEFLRGNTPNSRKSSKLDLHSDAASMRPVLKQRCRKQTSSAIILFSGMDSLYAPHIEMYCCISKQCRGEWIVGLCNFWNLPKQCSSARRVLKDLRWFKFIRHHSSVEKSAGLNKFVLSAGPRNDSNRKPVNSNQCGFEPIHPQARVLNYCFQ